MKLYPAQKEAVRKNIISHGIFNSTATFKSVVKSQTTSGAELTTLQNVSGLTNIPCMVVEKHATIRDNTGAQITQTITKIKLNGFYPSVSLDYIAVIGDKSYDITAIDNGSMELFTELYTVKWGN